MPIETAKIGAVESAKTDYEDYSKASVAINRLIDAWTKIASETERSRTLRFQKGVNSDDLRGEGKLKADEMYNPTRLIDMNIRREQPQFINYLTQSRRSIILAPEDTEYVNDIENLEIDFTKRARYLGWEIPFVRCIDGAQTHGWDAIEIIFDESYPGHFCFHHVGHDNLIFALDCEDINNQEVVIRREKLTSSQLLAFTEKEGWDAAAVQDVIQRTKNQNSQSGEEVICEIYKVFFKKAGQIMVTWYARVCQGYLVQPKPLFLGVRDTAQPPVEPTATPGVNDYPKTGESEYPFTICKYIESEDPKIINLVGRAYLDEPVQEAASALLSSLVNGMMRASNVYASPASNQVDPNPTAAPKALNVVLTNGAIFDKPLGFFHLPYPDVGVIQAIQAIVSQNQQEQTKIDFAALNRKDSGKTATEIQAATNKASELSSVQIILISIFIRQAYAKGWRIYQSRVLQGKIEVDPQLLPLFGEQSEVPDPTYQPPQIDPAAPVDPMAMMQQPPTVKIATPKTYIIKSSGDVDVVQRAENLQRKMQAWPVLANTPIAGEFLKDILRLAFPEDAAKYIQQLDQAQQQQEQAMKMMLAQVSNVLKTTISNPDGSLKPEYQAHASDFQRLAQQVQQILGQGQQQQQSSQQASNQ